jgi:pimeloyl-ACP methyl ester carboxylesterase
MSGAGTVAYALGRPTLGLVFARRSHASVRDVWTDVGGLRVHARVAGPPDAPPLVLVHGLAVSGGYFAPLFTELQGSARIWAPDLPGFGRSARPREPLDLAGLAALISAWLDAVGVRRAVLLGNSVGCQIIVRIAAGAPERVAALVLTSPTIDATARSAPRQVARWFLAAVREPWRLWPLVAVEYVRAGLRATWRLFESALRDRPESALNRITAPVVIMRGARDPIVGEAWAASLSRSAPHGNLVEVPDGVHALPFDAPAAVAAVTRPLLTNEEGSNE